MSQTGTRYSTTGLEEAQYEPASQHRVLKNLLGIHKKREMDRVEFEALSQTMKKVIEHYGSLHQFTASDLCKIHHRWLGKIYSWAGQYRQVNISKAGFQFATAGLIPKLMNNLEKEQLKKFTPCCYAPQEEISRAIAEVHTELILIHPFREGNGRFARILSNLMALQAGLPLLDFGGIKGKKRQEYFIAVRSGLDRNYTPMEKVFDSIIRRTLHSHPR